MDRMEISSVYSPKFGSMGFFSPKLFLSLEPWVVKGWSNNKRRKLNLKKEEERWGERIE